MENEWKGEYPEQMWWLLGNQIESVEEEGMDKGPKVTFSGAVTLTIVGFAHA